MEGLLENISRNSNPKDNFYIVTRGNKSRLKTSFSTPLNGKGYELALVGLSTCLFRTLTRQTMKL